MTQPESPAPPAQILARIERAEAALRREALPEARAATQSLLRDAPGLAEVWCLAAQIEARAGHAAEAEAGFETALGLAPDATEIWLARAHHHLGQGATAAARHGLETVLDLAPAHETARHLLADLLERAGKEDAALDVVLAGLDLQAADAHLHARAGALLRKAGQLLEARDHFRRASDAAPENWRFQVEEDAISRQLADWDALEAHAGGITPDHEPAPVDAPWSAVLRADETAAGANPQAGARSALAAPMRAARSATNRPAHLQIGVFSARFHDASPVAPLAALFEAYDRERFEFAAFSYGRREGGRVRMRLIHNCDHFCDLGGLQPEEAAGFVAAHQLDIAILLDDAAVIGGGGSDSARPAPLTIAGPGCPTPCNRDRVDYVMTDAIITPPGHENASPVATVRLGHALWPMAQGLETGHAKRPPDTRATLGLPRDALVLACFHPAEYITPQDFDRWMRLLAARPESVLWLGAHGADAADNLCRAAEARGIRADRLVFRAPSGPASHGAADLFLETADANAPHLAIEALRAGVPILALAGTTPRARETASLLHAAGLPDLVVTETDALHAKALELAENPALRTACRDHLTLGRETSPAFDAAAYARAVEAALDAVYARWAAGLAPGHIDLSAGSAAQGEARLGAVA